MESYFAIWMKTRKAWDDRKSFDDAFRDMWKEMIFSEKLCLSLFILYDFALLLLSFVAAIEIRFLPVYGVFFALIPVAVLLMDRLSIVRDRRIARQRIERNREFANCLHDALTDAGLRNTEQATLVKDEAVRILNGKERQKATMMRYAFDFVVLVALAACFNFAIAMLEHDAPLKETGLLLIFSLVAAASIMLIAQASWRAYDRFSALPCAQLRSFIGDLTILLVIEAGASAPSCGGYRKRVRARLP